MSVARVGLLLMVACSTERDPCDISLLVECPDCPMGEVQYALPVRSFDVSIGGDLMTLHCGLIRHDARFREQSSVDLQIPYMFSSFAAWDEDTYTVEADTDVMVGPGAAPRWYLASYDGTGAERWRKDLGTTVNPSLSFERFGAGPGGVGPLDRDGEWRTLPEVIPGAEVATVKHDGLGNIAVGYRGRYPSYDRSAVSVVDEQGVLRWTQTWTSVNNTVSPSVSVMDLAIAPTGEVVALGAHGGGAVQLGTRRFEWLPRQQWFVAKYSAAGELAWAMPFDSLDVDHRAIVFSGTDVVVGSEYEGAGAPVGDYKNVLLSVVSEAGVLREVAITGTGGQYLHSLRTAPGGTGVVVSINGNDSKEIRIGDHTFNELSVLVKLQP